MSEQTSQSAVQLHGVSKRFPGVLANDQIDLEIRRGEIHALLGENGAGKSTLMSILSGLYRPDEGEIALYGRKAALRSPRDAIRQGIGMVHQHFMLVEMFTVAENVALGQEDAGFFLNQAEIERKIAALSEQYGLRVDPQARIWQLSVGEQQRVEIIKLLYRGAKILILDEPTAVLTPGEVEDLFKILRRMAEGGQSVIFISHKLDEVMAISDRITVLRRGRVAATLNTAETNPAELARLMVGRDVLFQTEKRQTSIGEPVLEAADIHTRNDKGLPAVKGVSFTVRAGEILGIAGVAGNGQRELAEVITGLRPSTSGHVFICRNDLTNCSPRQAIDRGVSHIPEDRLGMGLAPNLPISDNVVLKGYRQSPLSSGPFLDRSSINSFADNLIALYDISTPSRSTAVKLLSGGNLQKTIIAREVSSKPLLMVAAHPTRGLDVGATEMVHKTLLEQRDQGMAILLISEDLDEIRQLADRIAVMYEGEIMGILDADKADLSEIGMMMAGARMETLPARVEADHSGAQGERKSPC
jgi:general nucleoside transport system ATP-binding protein